MTYNRISIMNGLLAFTFRYRIGIIDMSLENHNTMDTALQQNSGGKFSYGRSSSGWNEIYSCSVWKIFYAGITYNIYLVDR